QVDDVRPAIAIEIAHRKSRYRARRPKRQECVEAALPVAAKNRQQAVGLDDGSIENVQSDQIEFAVAVEISHYDARRSAFAGGRERRTQVIPALPQLRRAANADALVYGEVLTGDGYPPAAWRGRSRDREINRAIAHAARTRRDLEPINAAHGSPRTARRRRDVDCAAAAAGVETLRDRGNRITANARREVSGLIRAEVREASRIRLERIVVARGRHRVRAPDGQVGELVEAVVVSLPSCGLPTAQRARHARQPLPVGDRHAPGD